MKRKVTFSVVATVDFDTVQPDDVHDFLDGLLSEIELPRGYFAFDVLTPEPEVEQ